MRPYLSELVGTFVLTLAVMSSLYTQSIPTPIVASITLGLLVYILGPVSGCHVNPAVSFGLRWANVISTKKFIGYVLSQFAGAGVAYLLATTVLGMNWAAPHATAGMATGVGEIIGTAMLAFGVGMLVIGKMSNNFSGIVVGTSLFVGIIIASSTSAGVLNPAIAVALQASSLTYFVSPLIGAILGVEIAKILASRK